MSDPKPSVRSLGSGIEHLHRAWGWFVGLGVLLVVLGCLCILGEVVTTLITVIVLGWLLLFSGGMALVHAFRTRTWSGFFLYLLSAVLRAFTGFLLIRYPLIGALSLTLLLAFLFIVGGVFRAVGASSLWFLGLAVGIDLIFEGTGLIALGSALHARATTATAARA